MSNQDNKNKEEIVDYRLAKLEEAVTLLIQNLSTLKDIVVKWDAKISEAGWPVQLTQERLSVIQEKINKMNEDNVTYRNRIDEELANNKKFMYQISGALIVLSLIAQLFGPILIDKAFGHSQQATIEYVQPK